MAANKCKILIRFDLLINLVFVAEYNDFGPTLKLLHILNQQRSFFKVADNKRRNKLFGLDVGTQIREAMASDTIGLQLFLYLLKFDVVVMLVDDINRMSNCFFNFVSFLYGSNYFV